MNVSEYYEYKKDNDKKIDDFNAKKEEVEKKEKQEKKNKSVEQVKNAVGKTVSVVTSIPHFAKTAGIAALAGLLADGYNAVKNMGKK